MPIQVSCAQCQKQFKVRDELAGKRIKCPGCGAAIAIPGGAVTASDPDALPAAPAPEPAFNLMDMITPGANTPAERAEIDKGIGPKCPQCGRKSRLGAALCVNCGYDFHSGVQMATRKKNETSGVPMLLLAGGGAIAAVVALWLVWGAMSGMFSGGGDAVVTGPPPVVFEKPKPVDQPPPAPPALSAAEQEAQTKRIAEEAAQKAAAETLKREQEQKAAQMAVRQAQVQAKRDALTKLEKDVNAAIDKGQEFLLKQYAGQGKFRGQHIDQVGHTALIVYALLKTGKDPQTKEIAESIPVMLRYAMGKPGMDSRGTYNTGLVMLALDQLREYHTIKGQETGEPIHKQKAAAYRGAIRSCVVGLNRNQKDNESFSYGAGAAAGGHDMSIHQYALLGMWAAFRSDIQLRKNYWEDQAAYLIRIQEAGGGWGYNTTKPASPAMTYSGMGSLAVCYLMVHKKRIERQILAPDDDPNAPPGAMKLVAVPPASDIERAMERGFEWIVSTGAINTIEPYALYGLERTCTLTNTKEINGVDWYLTLAPRVVLAQNKLGGWNSQWTDTCATAWYLLFLRRATEGNFNSGAEPPPDSQPQEQFPIEEFPTEPAPPAAGAAAPANPAAPVAPPAPVNPPISP